MPVSDTTEEEKVKQQSVHPDAPTLKIPRIPRIEMLASISGITPLPVVTQKDLAIDAQWYRSFYHFLDTKTNGRGADVIALLSFLVIGGSAAVLNLSIVLGFDIYNQRLHHNIPYPLFVALATEISIIYNFFLNDRFTFKSLIDGRRTWLQRMLRFHGPAMVGFVLTLILSTWFHVLLAGKPAIVPQSCALVIVTAVNFTMHRFWTYRPQSTPSAA